ncbi:MAG: hypothetical protein N2449_10390 [Bacteroidales bacterium]|nr:hypothetical protein [Bacteroidales bacterium]
MLKYYLLLAFAIFVQVSFAQISINNTGNNPHPSAALDIDFSNLGLLIPRVNLQSVSDNTTITSPETSLLVFNKNASMTGGQGVGYYYNAGTPASPNWVKFLSGKESWLILGNDNITAPTSAYGTTINNNFIGTTNAIDLTFATNNLERMRIKSTDNANLQVSFGSTSVVNYIGGNPSILQLHDWGTTTNDFAQLNLSTSSTNVGRVAIINFAGTQITNERRTAAIESYLTAYTSGHADGDLRFYTNNSATVGSTSYNERMRINPAGYVGINTTTPSAYLDIQTPSAGGPFLGAIISNNRNLTGNYALELNVKSNAVTNRILLLKSDGSEVVSFRGNGRVVIGNTGTMDDPNTLLDIVGGSSGNITNLLTVRSDYSANNTGTGIRLINSTSNNSDVGAEIVSLLLTSANGRSDLYFNVHGGGGSYGGLIERMRLTGSGNLGLGTSTPGIATQAGRNYLTISGINGAGILELITQEADADNVRVGGIQFVDKNSTAADKRVAFIGSNLSGTTVNNRGGNIDFWTKADNGNLAQAMIITNSGRVGIGQNSPTSRLHVSESTSASIAIRGEYTPATGLGVGVRGQTASNDGYGVVGYNSNTNAPTTFPQSAGVFGQTDAPNSIGVWGLANNNTTNQSFGVWGETRGANSIGVVGIGNGLTSGTLPTSGAGAYFRGQTYGVYAFSSGGSATYGVYAKNDGNNGNGIFAEASVGTGAWALWAKCTSGGYAGYFNGNVNITGSLSKGSGSFLIDHPLDPLNKTLRHNFVESPENLCLYRGKVKLDEKGEAQVPMPEYFKALTKEEEATIILTPIGKIPFLVSYEWAEDYSSFYIYGEPHREVSYQVMADRDDPVMKLLYKPVEEEKGNGNFEKGYLIYPKAYGYPESMSIESLREPKENY